MRIDDSGRADFSAVARQRWMSSGPLAGLAEIQLESLQPGSSIMPGKINPVLPEAALMAAAEKCAIIPAWVGRT